MSGLWYLDDLIALRCSFTGESWQEASRLVRLSVLRLHPNAGTSRRVRCQGSTGDHPSGYELLRAGVLPDADSLHQRVLETSLLLAIRDSSARITDGPYRGHRVFRAVSPRPDALMVDLAEGIAEPFFRALLAPLRPSDGGDGVPGLRITPTKRHLRLHLLDHDSNLTDACVVVRGISPRRWQQIWHTIKDTVDYGDCVNPLLDRSPRLSPGEEYGIGYQRQRCGPVALGSALLRRVGLIANAFALDAWIGLGGTTIHVEIQDGPSIYSVVIALQHPLFGIINDSRSVDTTHGPSHADMTFARVIDTDPTPSSFTGDRQDLIELPSLALRALGGHATRGRTTARSASGAKPLGVWR